MKNIILLIIDSMNYSHMLKYPFLTPFFNSLKSEGVFFDNMYSQAPYTEAATMNIYCGQNVLDNGGYLKRFSNTKKTIFEAFKEKGYVTYYNSFQPQCYPSSLRRGVDYLFYNVGFDLDALWSYRLYFYSNLKASGKLTDYDYEQLRDILSDNFVEWLRFLTSIKENDTTTELIQRNSCDFDSEKALSIVSHEYDKFLSNQSSYIDELLVQKHRHVLFSVQAFSQNSKIANRDFIARIQKKYRPFFKRLNTMNRRLNSKNCKNAFSGSIKQLKSFIVRPSVKAFKQFGKALMLSMNVFKDRDLFDRISVSYDSFKNAPSMKSHIDHYINWETHRSISAPSFACIHVDDIHNPEVFFTYDSDDMKLIDFEISEAKKVMAELPADYYGNITHDLSLRYADTKIRYLYDQLSQKKLLDNTIVLICADHGFSFSGNPLRDSFVTNMYLENYHIPCLITGTNYRGRHDELCCSKDIPVLLTYLADGKIPEEFDGKNLFESSEQYKELFIEYCGGGCPDVFRRELKIGCFDNRYLVATEDLLEKKLTNDDAKEVYDLAVDPLQLNNVYQNKIDISRYIELINNRKHAITSSFNQLSL